MKKKITSVMLLLAITAGMFSCQKNGLPSTPPGTTSGSGNGGGSPAPVPTTAIPPTDTVTSPLPVGTLITKGKWKVTSYVEGIENSTSKFDAFVFTFGPNGQITVDEKGIKSSGTWVYLNAVFYYGVPFYGSSPDGFNIYVGTKRPLSLLSKNLFISKKTTTNFYLDSVNPSENAHATFTKISL
jgi:hypothetical protein